MAAFTPKMLETYRQWRETAEWMGWDAGPANYDQRTNPSDVTSDTIRQRISSNCPWYYGLERILHGGNSQALAPVSMRTQ